MFGGSSGLRRKSQSFASLGGGVRLHGTPSGIFRRDEGISNGADQTAGEKWMNVGQAVSSPLALQRYFARTDFLTSKTSISNRSRLGSAVPFKGSRPDRLVFMLSTLSTSRGAKRGRARKRRQSCLEQVASRDRRSSNRRPALSGPGSPLTQSEVLRRCRLARRVLLESLRPRSLP